jgi:hypothetical protein
LLESWLSEETLDLHIDSTDAVSLVSVEFSEDNLAPRQLHEPSAL